MNTIYKFWGQLFGSQTLVDSLKNDLAHLMVTYNQARIRIAEAEQEFMKVKAHTIEDFGKLKALTLTKTTDAAGKLKADAIAEQESLNDKHARATAMVKEKIDVADDLHYKITTLGSAEHPL